MSLRTEETERLAIGVPGTIIAIQDSCTDLPHHNSALHYSHDMWPGATKCARIAQAKLFDLATPGRRRTRVSRM